MKFDFDTFEFVGLIAPGGVIILALVLLNPQLLHLADPAVTLTLTVLGAYVIGHVVAAIGNIVEAPLQKLGVRNLEAIPCEGWIERGFISRDQRAILERRLQEDFSCTFEAADRSRRRAIAKQMYLLVVGNDGPHRLETFYGLCSLSRGFVVSFFFATIFSLAAQQYVAAALCGLLVGLMLLRVQRFNDSYSRELLQQFCYVSSRGRHAAMKADS